MRTIDVRLTGPAPRWRPGSGRSTQPPASHAGGIDCRALHDGGIDCSMQVQLDGSIRKSGKGLPPWQAFVEDLPEKDSLRRVCCLSEASSPSRNTMVSY